MSEPLFLPTLHSFAMDNIFTGSRGAFRFRAAPVIVKKTPKEVDMERSSITAAFWHGEKCYELSQMEGERSFPMSEAGLAELRSWLESNI